MFPNGITKAGLAHYYEGVAEYMLPFLRERPLVLQRFPEGIEEEGFYQKNASDYFPDWIEQVEVEKQGGTVNHVVCNDVDTLLYLVNQGSVTFHAWLSRKDRLNNPDLLVFDLDPQGDGDFDIVRAGALNLRDLLGDLGLSCFVQTTGSRGLHVLVALDRSHDFDTVRAFARDVAERLAEQDPNRFTTEQRKSKRGGRVFIDTLRNSYAQTAVAPYSLRAKRGAPAATPLEWREVERGELRPDGYDIANVLRRLGQMEDPWKRLFERPQTLDAPMKKLRAKK